MNTDSLVTKSKHELGVKSLKDFWVLSEGVCLDDMSEYVGPEVVKKKKYNLKVQDVSCRDPVCLN